MYVKFGEKRKKTTIISVFGKNLYIKMKKTTTLAEPLIRYIRINVADQRFLTLAQGCHRISAVQFSVHCIPRVYNWIEQRLNISTDTRKGSPPYVVFMYTVITL